MVKKTTPRKISELDFGAGFGPLRVKILTRFIRFEGFTLSFDFGIM